jgi:ketosteroid isomerase-like protein
MKLKTFLVVLVMIAGTMAIAQSKKELQVAAAVEALKANMINPDSAKLAALVMDDLSYGHSGGKIEDKQTFIHTLVSGQSDFVSIDLSDQKIVVYKNTAVVRHLLNAQTNDNGKPGTVKLSILTVWIKKNGHWQMIARQAVKPNQ